MNVNKFLVNSISGIVAVTVLGMTGTAAYAADVNTAHSAKSFSHEKVASIQEKKDTDIIKFPDSALNTAIKEQLNLSSDSDLTIGNLKKLTRLEADGKGITDLTGLENCSNLKVVRMSNNNISDISPLSETVNAQVKAGDVTGHSYILDSNHITDLHNLVDGLDLYNGENTVWVRNQTISLDPIILKPGVTTASFTLPTLNSGRPSKDPDLSGISVTVDGGIFDNETGVITWNNVSEGAHDFQVERDLSSHGAYSAKYTLNIQLQHFEQSGNAKVEFETTVSPGNPDWYGVIPQTITLSDTAKDADASVSLVNANDKKTAYNGNKLIDVKVRSDNSYQLIDANVSGESVEYKLDKDGKNTNLFESNDKEQDLGTLSSKTSTLSSKAHLKGKATKTGKYVDTLHYHFVEQ